MERPRSLLSFFLFHFRDSDFFFGNGNGTCRSPQIFYFPADKVWSKQTSFFISLFMLKPSQIYLSNRWQHCNYFSIGSNKPEHGDKPTTPFSSFRFGNRSIQVSVLTSFPKPKPRFYKRDKNLVFGFGNEVRTGLREARHCETAHFAVKVWEARHCTKCCAMREPNHWGLRARPRFRPPDFLAPHA
jgi:hypothetical protein